jgi:hypothetical protein
MWVMAAARARVLSVSGGHSGRYGRRGMELHLTSDQRQLLQEILEERHRDLLREFAHTDHLHFKEVLRAKAKKVESLLDKVAEELVTR